MDLDGLVTLLRDGERAEVLAGLQGLTDQDRKKLGPKVRGWITRGIGERISPARISLAGLAMAGGSRQAVTASTATYGLDVKFTEDAAALLCARAPAWLPDFADALLDDEGSWNWRLVRALVLAEAIPAPDHPEYFRGTVRGLPDYSYREAAPLIDRVDLDPGLVGDHLLSMLGTEGSGRLLAFHDKYMETQYAHEPLREPSPDGTWRQTLAVLAEDGRLDRGRLLDVVLAAPLRDWAAADVGWYISLHDALAPTIDEVAERQGTYARLLTAEHGPSVRTAQRELLRLFNDSRFEPLPVIDASRSTLGRTDKALVGTQLRLLGKLSKAHPHPSIADVVQIALDHPRAEIREQATKLLAELGGPLPARAPKTESFVLPPVVSRPSYPEVTPVSDADELAEVLLGLIEDVDPIELERAIDGLLRFATHRPASADVLLARIAAIQFFYDDARIAAAVLTQAWLSPRKRLRSEDWPIILGHSSFPAAEALPNTMVGALGRRLTAVAHAIRHGHQPSLALPTAADGSIDAVTLSRRFASLPRRSKPLGLEAAIALLRVGPEDRAAVSIPPSLRKAASVSLVLDNSAAEWARDVVMRKRTTWDSETAWVLFRDTAANRRGELDGILSRRSPELTVPEELSYGEYEARFEQTLAICALALPHDADVLAAHAHPYLNRDLGKDRAASVPILDAIARSRVPNNDPDSSALVLGLAAKDVRARTAAQDALVDLARVGLLDGMRLGQQAAAHLADGIVVGQRVCTGLGEAARSDAAAVIPVLEAMQALIDVLPGRRDAGAFLELAADLAERTGRTVRLPDAYRELAAGKSSSLLAKAARRLRALEVMEH